MAVAEPGDRPSASAAATVLEVELKLRAADPAPLLKLSRRQRLGPGRLGPVRVIHESDRYLDTSDGRLAAAGWACRLRTRGGVSRVSLKGRASVRGSHAPHAPRALHRRAELEGPATTDPRTDGWPESAARSLVVELAMGRPLVEGVTLRQRRSQRDVVVHGEVVGVLTLDRVEVRHMGARVGRLWSVELEFSSETVSEGLLIALDAALLGLPGLAPDPLTKLERAEALIDAAAAGRGSG